MLKSLDISTKFIVANWDDNPLMNVVETIFPKLAALFCQYHISKYIREKCKTNYKVKDLKSKDGKEMKSKDVCMAIMDAWKVIMGL